MRILITGATGTVGGLIVPHIVDSGHEVRALVRDPARATFPPAVDVVQGDLTNADDVRRALDGVDRAFLNMADDNGAAFASAAGEVGLKHAVLLSSFSAVTRLASGDDNIVAARHRAGEQALIAAGVPSTFLRPAGFDYNILMWSGRIDDGVIRTPTPDVSLPVIDPADIAASAAAVLLAETPPTGAFSITGPQKLSVRDQAQILSDVLGRELHVERISSEEAIRTNFPEGTPDFVATSVLETMSDEASVIEVSPGVQQLTGRSPRTFREWATDHLAAFRVPVAS